MPFKRYIVDSMVEPDLGVDLPSFPEPGDDVPSREQMSRYHAQCKERVVEALAELLSRSGDIRNTSRFTREFKARENATSSALGNGIAIPHLRSMQPRKLIVAIARSVEGLHFDAPDAKPVNLFFCLTAPPYNDKVYLRFHKWVATEIIAEAWLIGALMQAQSAHDMVKILRGLYY